MGLHRVCARQSVILDRPDRDQDPTLVAVQFSDGAAVFVRRVFRAALGQCEIFCAQAGVPNSTDPPATFQAIPTDDHSNAAYIEQAQLVIRTTANLTIGRK